MEEYIQRYLRARSEIEIFVEWHAVQRMVQHGNITEEEVELTVRHGKIHQAKCAELPDKPYSKICTYRYFPNRRLTLEAIVLYHEGFQSGEVRTVWIHKGRKERKPSDA